METNSPSLIRWDRLCRDISSRNVIAVIGNEMYKFLKDGKLTDIETYCAGELKKMNAVGDSDANTIAATVEMLLNEKNADISDIIDDLNAIIAGTADFPLLTNIVNIEQLFFYVNTTVYGNILEEKLANARSERATEGNFSINESFADYGNINEMKMPFVFNIFGSLSNNIAPALKEEEMLEFTTALIGKMDDPKFGSILDALKNKTLLFLGCSQPYWIIRFLFRLLSNERIDNWQRRQSKIIIANDKGNERENQFRFLKSYRAVTYEGDTAEFVKELKGKWEEYIKVNPPRPKSIFISYSRKDFTAANKIYETLSSLKNVQCWFDVARLESGDDFTEQIMDHINKADLFIPLISGNSVTVEENYVKREWNFAINQNSLRRNKQPDKQHKYILPIVIDNIDLGNKLVTSYFPSAEITGVPEGNVGEGFLTTVRTQLELI